MKKQILFILAIILTVFIVMLSVVNFESVDFNYLIGSTKLPVIVISLYSFIVGYFVSFLINLRKVYKLQKENQTLKKSIDQIDNE
ncbi:lipopolysaccharide assembly LapA domain-containing protein [Gottfriedia sp. NPDC057991]|uniref:LapA family protein n=1 Tax=Gottfriedia sp. NPDC057991 TaxID=3346298 RepID=UPI0036D78419